MLEFPTPDDRHFNITGGPIHSPPLLQTYTRRRDNVWHLQGLRQWPSRFQQTNPNELINISSKRIGSQRKRYKKRTTLSCGYITLARPPRFLDNTVIMSHNLAPPSFGSASAEDDIQTLGQKALNIRKTFQEMNWTMNQVATKLDPDLAVKFTALCEVCPSFSHPSGVT